jgi:hypothetical protein
MGHRIMLENSAQLAFLSTPPAFPAMGGMGELHPRLHEEQILENLEWRESREHRVTAHKERVEAHLRRFSHSPRNSNATQGKRRATWCVELKQRFTSVTEAGRFVGRPPSNILQAIYSRNRCGRYHWEYFDEARHQTGLGVQGVASTGLTAGRVQAGGNGSALKTPEVHTSLAS